MSDHQKLHDAFAEYERRADAHGAAHPARLAEAPRARRTTASPMVLVAASVVLVLVLAGAVVWLAGGFGGSHGSGGNPAAGVAGLTPTRTEAALGTGVPSGAIAPTPVRTEPSGTVVAPVKSSAPTAVVSSPASTAGGTSVPGNAAQMERAFRRVLGDEATFIVRQHHGNYLIGTLTAGGSQGGFDIQAVQGNPGDEATCEDPGQGSHCTLSKPAAGGSLAVERERYQKSVGGGVLFYVDYVFPDGATYILHLSNRADPKGGGQTYGPMPPLTLKQMVAIAESDRWAQP